MNDITIIDDYLPSKYELVKMAVEIGGCAIIVYASPPLVLTVINWLPWIYSAWKIYSKFTSTYRNIKPAISWLYVKVKGKKVNDDIPLTVFQNLESLGSKFQETPKNQ